MQLEGYRTVKKSVFVDIRQWGGPSESLVLYSFSGRGRALRHETTVPLSGGTIPADLQNSHFTAGLPLSLLNFRVLSVPFSDRQKLRDILPFELDSLLLGGSDRIIFDFRILSETQGQAEVLVTYVERQLLGTVLQRLTQSGIDPAVVTSLELRKVLRADRAGLAESLLSPTSLDETERIDLAGQELSDPTVNLRTGPFDYTKDREKVRKKLRVAAILALVAAVLINGDLVLRTVTARQETSALNREMRRFYTELFPKEKKITDEVYQLKSHLKEIGERGDALAGAPALPFLMNISKYKSEGVSVSEITFDRDAVTVKGEAGSMDNVETFKKGLSEVLRDVSASDIKSSVDKKTLFTVTGKYRTR